MIPIKKVLVVLWCLMLVSCQGSATKIHIRFNDVQGLVQGDRVLADGEQIGKVSEVVYTSDGNFLVDIVVPEKFRQKLVANARFYIVPDPTESGKKAVEIVISEGPGELLADGATVQGRTKAEDLVNDIVGEMQKGLSELENQIQGFLGSLKEAPQREEIQKLRKQLEQLAQKMKRAGEAAKEKLEKEVLPRLEQEIEKLKERLKKLGREKEVEPLEVELNELKKI